MAALFVTYVPLVPPESNEAGNLHYRFEDWDWLGYMHATY